MSIFDLEAIKAGLDNAEIDNDEFNGIKVQRVYLGTVMNLTPSGKYYLSFAHSNVEVCASCEKAMSLPCDEESPCVPPDEEFWHIVPRLLRNWPTGKQTEAHLRTRRSEHGDIVLTLSQENRGATLTLQGSNDEVIALAVKHKYTLDGWCVFKGIHTEDCAEEGWSESREEAQNMADTKNKEYHCEPCQDAQWNKDAEAELSTIGAFLDSGEGDPCDLFAARVVEEFHCPSCGDVVQAKYDEFCVPCQNELSTTPSILPLIQRLINHDKMVKDFYSDSMTSIDGVPTEDFREDFDKKERHILTEIIKAAPGGSRAWNMAFDRMEKFMP